MDAYLEKIGVAGILVVLILDKVFKFLAAVKEKEKLKNANFKDVSVCMPCSKKLNDLWNWHSETDSDGVKRWYTPLTQARKMDDIENKMDRYYDILTKKLDDIEKRQMLIAMRMKISDD